MGNVSILFRKICHVTEGMYKYNYNLPMNQTALIRKTSSKEC
jgi:hypothetical protein